MAPDRANTPGVGDPAVCDRDLFPPAQPLPRNRVLFRQGEAATHVFRLETGLVKLCRVEEDNDREIILDLLGPGGWLGISASILGVPHAVTAKTVASSSVVRVEAGLFHTSLGRSETLGDGVRWCLSRDLYRLHLAASALGCLPARKRVELALAGLCSEDDRFAPAIPEPAALSLRLSELAQLVAVTPEHLNRILADLEENGTIRRHRGRFQILKPERLPKPHSF